MSHAIVVVGGTGTIGREVVRALVARGQEVRIGVRRRETATTAFEGMKGVTAVALDADRPETLPPAFAGATKLFVVNAMTPAMGGQMRTLVDAAAAAGIEHVVRSSLFGAGDEPLIEEGRWHAEADLALALAPVPWTVLRPNQYFQNFASPAHVASVRDGVLTAPLGDARVSNIDARDIGEAAANVLLDDDTNQHRNATYTLTGPAAIGMDVLAAAIGEAAHRRVTYVPRSETEARERMLAAGMPSDIVDAVLGWYAYCREGRAAMVTSDAEHLLGRAPRDARAFAEGYPFTDR